MKRNLLLFGILSAIIVGLFPRLVSAQTLYQCYQEKGMVWTNIQNRAEVAAKYGVWQYKGTAAQNTLLASRLCEKDPLIGFSVVTDYSSTLNLPMTSSQTTVPVSSIVTKDGHTLVTADFGGKIFLTIEPSGTKQELVMCTGITSGAFSGCTRGLAFYGTSTAAVAGNAKTHSASSRVIMSNSHYVYEQFVDVNNKDQTIEGAKTATGVWTFGSLPIIPTTTPTDPQHAVSLDYLTSVTSTGCANASTAVRGCTEEATDAEVVAGTTSGATGSRLFVNPTSWLEYADVNLSDDVSAGEDLSAFNILYVSTTGSYYKARATVQAEVDRVAGVAYETITSGNYPRVYFPGSIIQESQNSVNTGYLFTGTGANDSAVGTEAWSNPTRITSTNLSFASATGFFGTSYSNYLKATNFGFSIPTGATIEGIEATIRRIGVETISDERVRIIKSNGSIGTTDKSSVGVWSTSATSVTYGGSTELWGETWTAADINSSTFGLALQVEMTAAAVAQAGVDSISMKIYYSVAPNFTTSSPIYLSDAGGATSTPGTIRKVLGTALGSNVWQFNPDVLTPASTAGTAFTPIMTGSGGTVTTTILTTSTNNGDYLRSTSTGAFWGSIGSSGGVSTTATKSLDTIYRNTSTLHNGKALLIVATVNLAPGLSQTAQVNVLSDSNSSPTVVIGKMSTQNDNSSANGKTVNQMTTTFLVPSNFYWKLESSGTGASLVNIHETEL